MLKKSLAENFILLDLVVVLCNRVCKRVVPTLVLCEKQ